MVHNANPLSLTVSWEAVADADGYQVQIQPVQASWLPLRLRTTALGSQWPTTTIPLRLSWLSLNMTSAAPSPLWLPTPRITSRYGRPATDATTSTDPAARRLSAAAQTGDAGAFTSAYILTIENPVIRDLDLRVERIVKIESATQASADTVNIRIENAAGTDIESYLTAGLAAAGAQSINDGQLTIRASDNSVRTFEMFVVCGTYDQVVNIEVYDREAELVARGSITCDPEPTDPPPPDTDQVLGCFTIEGVRAGESDRIFDPIDPFTTDASIQIVVTSYEMIFDTVAETGADGTVTTTYTSRECPNFDDSPSAYIRLVDVLGSGEPIVDDAAGFVDENGFIDDHSEVMGLDSHGKLDLNFVFDGDDTDADNDNRLLITVIPATETEEAQSERVRARRGKFRIFTPEDTEAGDDYYVEVYDPLEKARQAEERVEYFGPGDADDLEADENADGTITLTWDPGNYSNVHWVAGVRVNDDGSYDFTTTLWVMAGAQNAHTIDPADTDSVLPVGEYVFTVIAGQYNDNTGQENWDSQWAMPFAEADVE